LLAKIVVHRPGSFADVVVTAARALAELRIDGCITNRALLQALLADERFVRAELTTTFLDDNIAALLAVAADAPEPRHFAAPRAAARAGARIDGSDPLAVLAHGKDDGRTGVAPADAPGGATGDRTSGASPSWDGANAVLSPIQGTIVSVAVQVGDAIGAGQPVLVMEAMKMEHVVVAPVSGVVRGIAVAAGDTVFEGHALVLVEPAEVTIDAGPAMAAIDLDVVRPDLAEVLHRQGLTLDAARPDAVARRRKTGQRTTRENVADLCDEGSFVEYGSLAIAAQRSRRPVQELIERTPADGMVAGFGRVNGDLFADDAARCVVMSYDYTVLAGTQGLQNHRKKDRLFELAERAKLPVVIFTEGGGGRPGDTDGLGMAGLDCMAFALFAGLSGLVPLVGINSGRCFAGNAALLGCCDVVIATANSSIGMGGPAMIEGGGLGVFHPDEVGPMSVQVANGVVDIAVADEEEAVAVAKQYLSYFQGPITDWTCADQRLLRSAIPENRLRIYDVRSVIDTLADEGSVLELRRAFAPGMITSLARVEGRPIGIVANNPVHLAGAIDSDGADKAARFLQLCDAFDIPVLYLCDTPGMMVGPAIEKTALVRHCSRMFVVGASLTVPFFTIVLRKGYGLGAQAMAGGSFKAGVFTIAWPTGEFGGMGLEGAVKLGYRNDLAAIEDPAERKAAFDRMVARAYEHGKALNTASHFEIDDVIDPAESRHRIVSALRSMPAPALRTGKKRPCIDTW
jgi:acetyl-CoA carboxylase carboxyltransferase component/biotin carboxyl carrier protein